MPFQYFYRVPSFKVWTCLAATVILRLSTATADDDFALNPEPSDYDKPGVAAYFGDGDTLRKELGNQTEGAGTVQTGRINWGELAELAVEGHHFEILDLLVSHGWPHDANEIAPLFWRKDLDPTAMAEIVRRVPDFKTKFGELCLLDAVNNGGRAGMEWLLKAGIRPGSAGPRMLMAAIEARDSDLLETIIKAGADPDSKYDGVSAVDFAAQIRSAKMLAILDRRGRYSGLLAQLRRDYTPPKDSPFIGNWIWRPPGGGFGTLQVVLFDDGSAVVLSDTPVGGALWRGDGKHVQVQFLDEKGNVAKDNSVELELKDGRLALVAPETTDGLERRLERVDKLPDSKNGVAQYPRFERLEAAFLDADKQLWLQINGCHIRVPMTKLIEGARALTNYETPVPQNLLRWVDFIPGPIPQSATKNGTRITIVPRFASPAYEVGPNGLGFDHEHPVTLAEGVEMAIFPSLQGHFKDETTGPEGEWPSAFVIMSKNSMPHGRNWLLIFIRKSAKNPG